MKKEMKILGIILGICFVVVLSATALRASELRLPEEKEYAEINFPPEELKDPGWHLDPLPASWQEMNLEGTWKIKRIPLPQLTAEGNPTPNINPAEDLGTKEGYFQPDYATTGWEDIRVPWSWNLTYPDCQRKYFDGVGWYKKNFNLPATWKNRDQRVLLKFEASKRETDLWVNGEKIGKRHIGGNTAFSFDITDAVKDGKNDITLRVYSHSGGDFSFYRRRSEGGLWQPVRLLLVPKVYAEKVLITPHIQNSEVEAECWVNNPSDKEINKTLEVRITPLGIVYRGEVTPGKEEMTSLGSFRLNPGVNQISFKVKIADPKLWSPDNPFLYSLTLLSDKDELGLVRFGMREFAVNDGHFYLNGQRIKLMGLNFVAESTILSVMKNYQTMDDNHNSFLKRAILSLKKMGVNIVRPHDGLGQQTTNFYNLADECGLMVYDEWGGGTRASDYGFGGSYTNMDKALEASYTDGSWIDWVYFRYNHPSVVMWDMGGNELYQQGESMVKILNKKYDTLKAIDKQNRPICSSSGRHSLELLLTGQRNEKVDFVDDHQYRGVGSGSWTINEEHYLSYQELVKKIYGKIPMVAFEYGVGGGDFRYRDIDYRPVFGKSPMTEDAKRLFCEYVTSPQAETGGYIRGLSNEATFRAYATDEATLRRWDAYRWKNVMEITRRQQILDGATTNAIWYDMIIPVLGCGEPPFRENLKYAPAPYPLNEDVFRTSPLFYAAKRVQTPEFICAVFNNNLFAGKELKLDIYTVNDLPEENGFSGVVQIRNTKGEMIHQGNLEIGRVSGMDRKSIPYRCLLPKDLDTGFYTVELYLFKNGQRVSDNEYPFFVLSDRGRFRDPAAGARAALYDSAGRVFAGLEGIPTTKPILDNLKIPYTLIDGFDDLDKYQVLIVGANSIDDAVIRNGGKIRAWIENGGRVLCFEQTYCGVIPFLPEEKTISGLGGSYSEMVEPASPVFQGLKQENFDTWYGENGLLYKIALAPMNTTVLASGPTNFAQDKDSIKMILSDSRVGKGEVILSQFLLTSRYNQDSVATKLTENLLEYILDPTHPELVFDISGEKSKTPVRLADEDTYFVDLRRYANRGFRDDIPGDKLGGWTDFGPGADYRDIPTGRQKLAGAVAFDIINPDKNNGNSAIVLRGVAAKDPTNQRPYFPEKVTGITVGQKLDELYFLHTCMYATNRKEDLVLNYRVHYQDGKTVDIPVRDRIEIGDDYNATDLPDATVDFRNRNNRGLYLTKWLNPSPETAIDSLDIISNDQAVPVVVAITGKLHYEEKSQTGVRGK